MNLALLVWTPAHVRSRLQTRSSRLNVLLSGGFTVENRRCFDSGDRSKARFLRLHRHLCPQGPAAAARRLLRARLASRRARSPYRRPHHARLEVADGSRDGQCPPSAHPAPENSPRARRTRDGRPGRRGRALRTGAPRTVLPDREPPLRVGLDAGDRQPPGGDSYRLRMKRSTGLDH